VPAVSVKRPRVLFVGAFPSADREVFGGMVTSCRALLGSSLPRRLDLDLLDSTQISHPPPGLPVRLLLAVRRFASFIARFERRRPDAVLLFTATGASVVEKGAMAWYARLRGVPALMFPRGGELLDTARRSRFARLWMRCAFRGARRVLCQGPAWQAFACEVLGLRIEHAPVVLNWTATEEFLAVGRDRGMRDTTPIKLLFVGWLDQEKGIGELLAACRALAGRLSLKVALVGKGNMSAAARQYVQANRLADVVEFHDWLRGPELVAQYAAADIFVLPSWAEGLPNAMIEAMAARLAVIVSAVGNIPDVLTDERSCLLVSPRDAAGLQRALERVILDRELRERLAAAGHDIAAEKFSVEPAADALVSAIRDAIGNRSSAALADAGT
jgi:glycosyltransferase involved in cell wall biosynthesis